MTSKIRSSKSEARNPKLEIKAAAKLEIRTSSFFRHSSFGLRHFKILWLRSIFHTGSSETAPHPGHRCKGGRIFCIGRYDLHWLSAQNGAGDIRNKSLPRPGPPATKPRRPESALEWTF